VETIYLGFPDGVSGKEPREDSVEEGMATNSSTLAWKIP